MELDRLKDLETVARCGSMNKAAQELGVSCATLSARIIRLEEQLGLKLFDRTPEGMTPTEEGRVFLPRVRELLARQQELIQNITAAQSYASRRLRIAVSGSNLPLHLGPFLDRLNLAYPSIHLELLDDSRYGVEEGLRSGYADIYFAPVMDRPVPRGIAKYPVAPASQYAILPRAHPLAERAMVSLRDLDGEQFILYPQTAESAIREFQLRNLEASGIHYSVYDSDSSVNFFKLLVPVGKGVLFIPHSMMNLPPRSVSVPVAPVPHPATVCFFYKTNDPSENVRAFVSDFQLFKKEMLSREHGAPL